ncbi:MAG: UTP--glucose-1-phosphate uridylyltransferase [Myxococcota bacterium]
MAHSKQFKDFVQRGGRYLHISNVDNLGASLAPWVIGAHIEAGRQVSVEVAERYRGDAGGAPVRCREKVEILEGFRFPKDFDFETLPVFNTNTMTVNGEAFKADYPLTWFRADKELEGQPVVQFERLMGEITSFVESSYLRVPRQGAASRFLPIKTPEDLERLRPQLMKLFALGSVSQV